MADRLKGLRCRCVTPVVLCYYDAMLDQRQIFTPTRTGGIFRYPYLRAGVTGVSPNRCNVSSYVSNEGDERCRCESWNNRPRNLTSNSTWHFG